MSENGANRTEINAIGEFKLIEQLTRSFKNTRPSTIKGIGDDAAVVGNGKKVHVISTDMLIEGIHFDMMYTPLKHLGYKAVVVNLSDVFAMNAEPEQVTVSIAISNRFSLQALEELYEGIRAACEGYQVDLVGGDTSSSLSGLLLSVTAIGTADKKKITYRNTAKEGDLICLSGSLGAAYVGLQLLEREKQIYLENPNVQPDLEDQNYIVGRQLKPEARRDMFHLFQKADLLPTAMIDVSDGLSSDLLHICTQSGVGCEIREAAIPIDEDTYNMALKFNLDPITCAMNGGEDYELLFTINPEDETLLSEAGGVSIIGEITDQKKGYIMESKAGKYHQLVAQGWNHLQE